MKVQSKSNLGTFYEVTKETCSCLDFKYRGHLRPCKHIKELKV